MKAARKLALALAGVAFASLGSSAMAGDPIPGLDVKLGKNPGGIIVAHTTTGSDGKFVFSNLDAGKYQLSVTGPQSKSFINTTRSNIKHQSLAVGIGAQVTTVSVQLGAQAVTDEIEITASKGQITGTVNRAEADRVGATPVTGVPKKATLVTGTK